MALLAAQAQAALAQRGDVGAGDGDIRRHLGQHQVKNGRTGVHDAAGATVFDLMLPRLAAGVRVERKDLIALGEGGLCLSCPDCCYPICPFGK